MAISLEKIIKIMFGEDKSFKRVLFRVDAARKKGLSFGHLSRCLLLSHELKKSYKTDILFVMKNYREGVEYALSRGEQVRTIEADLRKKETFSEFIKNIEFFKPQWVVIDLVGDILTSQQCRQIAERGVKIVFIDDNRFESPDVDIFLNSSVLALKKTKIVRNTKTKYLLGPEYFIFSDCDSGGRLAKESAAFKILITFGGSDPTNLTTETVRALLKEEWKNVEFTIVLGPGNRQGEELDSVLNKKNRTFKLLVSPDDLLAYFKVSDLVICSGGRTMYELKYLNIPNIAIASIKHEEVEVEEFGRRNFLIAGLSEWNENRFISILKEYLRGNIAIVTKNRKGNPNERSCCKR